MLLASRSRRGLIATTVALCLALPGSAAASTVTFTYTGSEQSFAVPVGVAAVTITAVASPGGTSAGGQPPGNGAVVTATVALPAGTTTLFVEVGGVGMGLTTPVEGFNGGGAASDGGGGGGASDVRTCSISTCNDLSADDSRLVVAGGGGGSGGAGCGGGQAGDATVTGPGAGGDVCVGSNGGFGGTAGGAGCAGQPGSLGQDGQSRIHVLPTPGEAAAGLDNFVRAAVLLQPAPQRFVFARKHLRVSRAGTIRVTVPPYQRGRELVKRHRYAVRIRLWVSYTPTGGSQRNRGLYGLYITHRASHRSGGLG